MISESKTSLNQYCNTEPLFCNRQMEEKQKKLLLKMGDVWLYVIIRCKNKPATIRIYNYITDNVDEWQSGKSVFNLQPARFQGTGIKNHIVFLIKTKTLTECKSIFHAFIYNEQNINDITGFYSITDESLFLVLDHVGKVDYKIESWYGGKRRIEEQSDYDNKLRSYGCLLVGMDHQDYWELYDHNICVADLNFKINPTRRYKLFRDGVLVEERLFNPKTLKELAGEIIQIEDEWKWNEKTKKKVKEILGDELYNYSKNLE